MNRPTPTANHRELILSGSGNIELFMQEWWHNGGLRGVVAIVHGAGEHSGRYSRLVRHLVSKRFAVTAFDTRGHGRSPGQRGHVDAWSDYREDLRAFVHRTRMSFPFVPVFLYGHSFGALVASDYVLYHPEGLTGLILTGHPLQPDGAAKPHLVFLARLLSRIWPTFPLNLGLNAEAISREVEVVKAYREDPLVHGRVTPRWGVESLDAIDRVRQRAGEIMLPLLIVHGGSDRINSTSGSRELYSLVSSADKQLKIYEGGAHEPHNDIGSEQFAIDIEEWLVERLRVQQIPER